MQQPAGGAKKRQRRWQTIDGGTTREPAQMQCKRAAKTMTRVVGGEAKIALRGVRRGRVNSLSAMDSRDHPFLN
jgi:hypothetical protein